jgi:hypothetical protein
MRKPATPSKAPRPGPALSSSKAERKAAITQALEKLDSLVPETPKVARLIGLLRSWLSDVSGYDERTWPKLMKALDEERDRVGARKLFDC